MPSKNSKTRKTRPPYPTAESSSSKNVEGRSRFRSFTLSDYSEADLHQIAKAFSRELEPQDRVLLEGPMGVGKTTFARFLLEGLGVQQPPEGSPTFAIAHEYDSASGGVVHIDFYRLKSEAEIDDAGIPSYYWERPLIVISEWISAFPGFEDQVKKTGRTWQVQLEFIDGAEGTTARRITIRNLREI